MAREEPSVDARETDRSSFSSKSNPAMQTDPWRVAVLAMDDLDYKRRLLDDMEAVRGRTVGESALGGATSNPAPAGPRMAPVPAMGRGEEETEQLRERVRSAEATCAMLEEEIVTLERQTLTAMAEAGRLRKTLDEVEKAGGPDGRDAWWRERTEMQCRLLQAERSRDLLTTALMESESEIARLTRTLETTVQRLNLAG